MSPKGGKKALKAARTVRTSPVVDPQHLLTRSPIDDGARSQMFNLSVPLRRRSGGPPLKPEPVLSTDDGWTTDRP
jgi:hypothetical protein